MLDALRPSVEAKVGPNVESVVDTVRVDGDWAFVMAEPQRKVGRPIDGKAQFGEDWDHMGGLTVTAALRFQRGGWTLVDSQIGATDVWYCDVGPRSVTGC